MEEYFSDILVYETSAGVVWKEDIKVGGKGVREDVVYRDATTSIKTDKTLMRQLKKDLCIHTSFWTLAMKTTKSNIKLHLFIDGIFIHWIIYVSIAGMGRFIRQFGKTIAIRLSSNKSSLK